MRARPASCVERVEEPVGLEPASPRRASTVTTRTAIVDALRAARTSSGPLERTSDRSAALDEEIDEHC